MSLPHKLLDGPLMTPGCKGTARTLMVLLALLPQAETAATDMEAVEYVDGAVSETEVVP